MWQALLSGGLSLFGGLSARNAQKKTQKLQIKLAEQAEQRTVQRAGEKHAYDTKLHQRINKWLKKQKETTTTQESGGSYVAVDEMMQAAEQSGFNPQTFLNAGGLAAYTRSNAKSVTTRTGHNAAAAASIWANLGQAPLVGGSAPPVSHVQGAGEAFANAGMAALNTFENERIRLDTQDFQRELLATNLAAQQRRTETQMANRMGSSFFTPGFSTSGSTIGRQVQGGLTAIGAPTAPTREDVTNPHGSSLPFWVNPGWKNADVWSTRYGEPGEWISAPFIAGADVIYNINRARNEPSYKADVNKVQTWLEKNVAGPGSGKRFFDDFWGGLKEPALSVGGMPYGYTPKMKTGGSF